MSRGVPRRGAPAPERRHRRSARRVAHPPPAPTTPSARPAPAAGRARRARRCRPRARTAAPRSPPSGSGTRRARPTCAPAEVVEHAVRHEAPQRLVVVRVGRLVEVVLGLGAAIGDQQRRRVVGARSRQQLHDVVVQLVRQRVLERGEAVDDRRQVGLQLAGAFHRQQHAFLAAGLGEPEPLVAARLLVDLDHPRAVRLHAPHLPARVVLAVDLGVDRRPAGRRRAPSPDERMRGPSMRPASTSSACAKTSSDGADGSYTVVTP